MEVHLCRHAESAPGEPDELRELTAAGITQATTLGRELAATEPRATVVLTSPLLRARQTAEAIARETGLRVLADTRLAPGATLETLRVALRGLDGPVVAVGHQPDCSEIAREATGHDPGFPVAGHAIIELEPQ